jgi:amino acid transporter
VNLLGLLLGRRLANREAEARKIGAFEGIPAMGLDGLGSSAYGPEAALTVLIPLGAASLSYITWVMTPIVALLLILFASYWQTIRAYPNNGGSYIVSKDNLGANASLLAAAALMIDYVLNVAVGISAGIGALVSAVPSLHPYILPLCLGVLALTTVVNLRGTLDAGRFFALPTYLFVASFMVILALGLLKAIAAGGNPSPVVAPPPLPQGSEAVTLWLLLRAFASGCTAMTGVEAVSNGMSAFRDPPVKYGHRTLSAIVMILGVLLMSIAYLAQAYRIGAMDQLQYGYQSILSQLASAVVGRGVFYYVAVGSVLCVLALSANTSFVDFPRLCRLVAEDSYLPKSFAVAGRRLVYSVGIFYLAATAGALLVVFGGITDRLIPLFAIGAFLTFTLSQAGMVVHWRRAMRQAETSREQAGNRMHFAINAVGTTTTSLALIIIVTAKFAEGAWITILVIPCVIALLKAIHRYYDGLAAALQQPAPLELQDLHPPIVLVTTEAWNKLTDRALIFAMSISPDVIGVHLTDLEGPDADKQRALIREQWRKHVEQPARASGVNTPKLMLLQAEYRSLHEPVLKLIQELETQAPHRTVAVLIPELIKRRWFERLLHTYRARRLRRALLDDAGPSLTVINVPWSLTRPGRTGSAQPTTAPGATHRAAVGTIDSWSGSPR